MTQQFFWTPPGGSEIALAPPTFVPQRGREGFDSLNATLYDTRAPYQHGTTPLGGVFTPRELFFPVMLQAESLADMAMLRRAFTKMFAPLNGIGVLRWVHDDGTTWSIRAEPSETPSFTQGTPFDGYSILAEVTLQAKEPFWYDPVLQTSTIPMIIGGFQMPFTLPFELGTMGGVTEVTNAGDVATPCLLKIQGPATRPIFTNATTEQQWGAGVILLENEQLIVSSAFGAKTAYKLDMLTGVSSSVIGHVVRGSDWITLVPGINSISIGHSVEAAKATLTVEWYNRYLGA